MRARFPLAGLVAALLAAMLLAGCIGQPSNTTPPVATQFPVPLAKTTVAGSGATFPKPLLETWGIEYARQQPTILVSYAGGGSGKGITDITNKDVVFAGSDAPLSDDEKSKAAGILQFPETLGLIGVVYNVDGIANGLKLDGATVGKIYVGEITSWNDAAIKALNPGVNLPDKAIVIVYRSDSSGTTFAFTDWLAKTSTDWASTMSGKASKKPDWTKSRATQLSGNGNDGVGNYVKTTPGSIGYIELAYIQSLKLNAAAIKNKAGEFLGPSTEGAKKAAAAAVPTLPPATGDWSDVSIVDAPGAGSYPISTFSYMMVYSSLGAYGSKATADQMNAFRNWAWWSIHEGQAFGPILGYAELPTDVVKIGEDALKGITV